MNDVLGKRELNTIRDIFSCNKVRNAVKSAYKKYINYNMNDTSVVMLHYPCSNQEKNRYQKKTRIWKMEFGMGFLHFPYRICLSNFEYYSMDTIATLLLGDINLNDDWDYIQKHFKDKLKNVCVVLVPHHGATSSWNEEIFNTISQKYALWIVSYGINSQYRHPNKKVIRSFDENEKRLILCNDTQSVMTRIF